MEISVNGQSYDSWDDVPEELRHLLESVMPHEQDGAPEGATASPSGPEHDERHVRLQVERTVERRRVTGAEAQDLIRAIREGKTSVDDLVPDASSGEVDPSHPSEPRPSSYVLNGEEVGADGQPLSRRRRWWRRD